MKRRFLNILLFMAPFTGIPGAIFTDMNSCITGYSPPDPAVNSSSPSYHFRSRYPGAWDDHTTWKFSPDATNWIPSTLSPTEEAASITIQAGHNIDISNAVSLNKILIYGQLTLVTGGKIKISNGDGHGVVVKDMAVFRIVTKDNYTNAIELPGTTQPDGSPLYVEEGGRVIVDKPPNENAGLGFEMLATNPNNTWQNNSRLIWNNGLVFPTSGITYFPSSPAGITPVFSIGPNKIPDITSAGALLINGVIDVRTKINFSAASATRTFRDGITGNDTLVIADRPGSQNITGANAIIGGSNLTISLGKILNFSTAGMRVTVPKDSVVTFLGAGKRIHKESGVTFIIDGTGDMTEINMDNTSGYVEINGHLKTAAKDGLLGGSTATITSDVVKVNEGSTIEYNATGDQNITSSGALAGTALYYNIIFSGSGTKKPNSAIRIHEEGSVTITGSPTVDAASSNIGPDNTENTTAFYMDGGRFILGTLGFHSTGTMPLMKGPYHITGGVIEFANKGTGTAQTIRTGDYVNIEVTGSNVKNSNGNIGIKQGGSFIIKSGGIYTSSSGNASIIGAGGNSDQTFEINTGGLFKTEVIEGFYGPPNGTNPSASVQTSITNIILYPESTIEYSRKETGANQNITFHNGLYEYQNLVLSGNGDKTAPYGAVVIKGNFEQKENARFKHNNGTLIFNNNKLQSVDAGGSVFYNLENQNTAGLQIVSDLSVKNALRLSTDSKLHLNKGDIIIVSDNEGTGRVEKIPENAGIVYSEPGGRFVVERYIPNHSKAWQLLSVPTQGGTIKETWQDHQIENSKRGVFITGPQHTDEDTKGFDRYSPAPAMKFLDPATGLFKGIGGTDNIISDHPAYFLFVRGDRSVDGKNNNTPTDVTLYTRGRLFAPGIEAPDQVPLLPGQWTIAGNPYAAAIDFKKLAFTGDVSPGYYIWDPLLTGSLHSEYGLGAYRHIAPMPDGTWRSVPGGGNYPADAPPLIQSGQAFFVFSNSDTGTLSFTEDIKTTQSTNVFRKTSGTSPEYPGIQTDLYLRQNNEEILLDGTLHLFNDAYSKDIDHMDAQKIQNNGENIALHSRANPLIVERRPSPDNTDTLYYILTGMNRRNYMLEITFYKTLHKAYSVYLNDGYKRTVTHLPAEKNEFRFAVDGDPASSFSDRFYLTFKNIIPPLSFHNEKADVVMGSHLITWEVQNQVDVKFFLVECSGDGQLFNLLQNITPSENKDDSYQFSHIPVYRDPVYYRIRAMMKNDTFNTSKILYVGHFNTPPYLTLYPNPAKQVLYLKFHYPQRGTCNIRLVNNEGKTSLVKTIHHNGYPMTDKIDLNAISGGVYHLEITKPGGAKEIQKILIEQTGK